MTRDELLRLRARAEAVTAPLARDLEALLTASRSDKPLREQQQQGPVRRPGRRRQW